VWFDLGALPPPPPIDADELHRVVPDTTVAGAYDRLYHLYRGMADRPPRDTFRDLV
jgi:hypothetical protein